MSNQPASYNRAAIKNGNPEATVSTFRTQGVFQMGPVFRQEPGLTVIGVGGQPADDQSAPGLSPKTIAKTRASRGER